MDKYLVQVPCVGKGTFTITLEAESKYKAVREAIEIAVQRGFDLSEFPERWARVTEMTKND